MFPVSYTHLDVYKRQVYGLAIGIRIGSYHYRRPLGRHWTRCNGRDRSGNSDVWFRIAAYITSQDVYKRQDTYTSGVIAIAADESFQPIVQEEIDVFEGLFPLACLLYTSRCV